MQQQQQQIEWRRAKVMEILSKGESNQSEIARILQVDKSIICRDLSYLRQQSRNNINNIIDERLPEEYEKYLVGLNSILREAWTTSQQAVDKREKIQALSLAKECYAMKLDLLTRGFVTSNASNNTYREAVKPKADTYVLNSTEDRDIQRSEEESNYQSGDTTTNQTF